MVITMHPCRDADYKKGAGHGNPGWEIDALLFFYQAVPLMKIIYPGPDRVRPEPI
jgi:hypothetical protein